MIAAMYRERPCAATAGCALAAMHGSTGVCTLLSSGSGLLKGTYSVPTQDTIPKPLGLTPAAGVSVSSLSFSTAYIARTSSWIHYCVNEWLKHMRKGTQHNVGGQVFRCVVISEGGHLMVRLQECAAIKLSNSAGATAGRLT